MLYIYLTCFSLLAAFPDTNQLNPSTSGSPAAGAQVHQTHLIREAGYFFALQKVPLSQKQYVFTADPLKRAVYITAGQTVPLSYTMTVKNARAFDMYFSANDYDIILSVKEEKVIDEMTSQYQGSMLVRHGQDKHRYAVHGIYYR